MDRKDCKTKTIYEYVVFSKYANYEVYKKVYLIGKSRDGEEAYSTSIEEVREDDCCLRKSELSKVYHSDYNDRPYIIYSGAKLKPEQIRKLIIDSLQEKLNKFEEETYEEMRKVGATFAGR